MHEHPNGARRVSVERNIYRRPDGRLELGYRDSDGRQRWQVVDGGLKAARVQLADVKVRMGRGERVAPAPKLTFGDAAARWYESQVATLRPATRALYRTQLDTHLLPLWGRRRLDSLSVDDVASLVERMQTVNYRQDVQSRVAEARGGARKRPREPDKGYATWTIRSTLVVANRVFEHAVRRCGWAGQNPVRQLERSERPRADQRDRRVLSGDELQRLLAAADDRYRPIFAFAAGTGTRLGEALGLKWRNVDLARSAATLTHQIDRRGEYVELKTKRSRRTVDLPDWLSVTLKAHKLAQPAAESQDDALVFAALDGKPYDHRNVAGRALARAVKAAGLHELAGLPDPTFHSLRHTFASAWIAAGGDIVELSAHLGHTNPSITASVYSHEFERAARSEARRTRLNGMFGSDMEATLEAAECNRSAKPAARQVTSPVAIRTTEPNAA